MIDVKACLLDRSGSREPTRNPYPKEVRHMTTTDTSDVAPIYDSLVAEHGDVPAEAREAAEEIQREAAEALDWSKVRGGG